MIKVIKDVDLIAEFDKYDMVLLPTNCYNKLSNGFARKMRKRYPTVHQTLMDSGRYGDPTKLGEILLIEDTKPKFCLCFITKTYNFRPDLEKVFINYEDLKKSLLKVNDMLSGQDIKIASPLLGTSRFDGGGDPEMVYPIFEECCKDLDLTIYDFFQKSIVEENKEEYAVMKEHLGKGDYKTFRKMVDDRRDRNKKYGHY